MPLSRRAFAQLVGAGTVTAALPFPSLVAANSASARARSSGGVIRLSSNENPYGPSPAAQQAMRNAFALAWRYPDEAADELIAELAKAHGIGGDHFAVGDGSGELLKLAANAFTGAGRQDAGVTGAASDAQVAPASSRPGAEAQVAPASSRPDAEAQVAPASSRPDGERKLVMADPTFEALGVYARVRGADIVKVPLTKTFAHDLGAMNVAGAGLIYVCNPNNPTGSITPKAALRTFLGAVPASAMVIVDEAYHHYALSSDYESVIPLVASHPNLIVLRTFSKIFGMAGLRLGYAIAQPALIEKMVAQGAWDSVNIMALAAGRASIRDEKHVADGRARNRDTKSKLVDDLHALGYAVVPSEANFVMIDTRRDVRPLISSLRERKVHVGRFFPALPQHLRVTIGRPEEMRAFVAAFRQVVA
jgi:histidinol-phosphate aminotransferase